MMLLKDLTNVLTDMTYAVFVCSCVCRRVVCVGEVCVYKGGVCRSVVCVGWHCVCRRIVRRRRVWCRGALRRRSAVCVEGLCAEEEGVCKACVWRRVVCVCVQEVRLRVGLLCL